MSEAQSTESGQRRAVRSFVIRAGRMTAAQKRGFEQHWPRFGLTLEQGELDPAQVFGRRAPLVLEIGFGMGHSLIAQAEAQPEQDYIGIEVHPPGVGRLLHDAGERQLDNIRVYQEDAIEVLKRCIPDASLACVQLFFPDPWPKKRHHKRRIVQPPFAQLIRRKLQIDGLFHMATDWQPYAEHMVEVMEAADGFENTATQGHYVPRPATRPVTKFERRGERLGHGVWDLVYRRID